MNVQLPDSRSIEIALQHDAHGLAQIFVQRGLDFEAQGRLEQALDDYGTALRILPDDARILCRRGQAFHKKGDLDRAITHFDAALREEPGLVDALYARACVWAQKCRHERALEDFDAVLRLDPQHALAQRGRERILSKELLVLS